MGMTNTLGFLICLAYIFAIIGLAELLRRRRGYSNDFTRKVVHIGVGSISWALPWLFDSRWPFVITALLFSVITFLDWRFQFFPAMASDDASNLGTVYFPIAAAVVVALLWNQPPLMVAALMPLTWGDGLAPVVGRSVGKHTYRVWGHTRTLEGSLTFFLATSLFTTLALWLMEGIPALSLTQAIGPALLVAIVTTLVEAVSLRGLDNLTITAVALLLLSQWPF
jgi:phytol kinase